MRVWKCLFSGNEMVSDSYKSSLIHDDACLEVKGKYIIKRNEQFSIACDDELEEDAGGETVLNIVDAHELNEV